MKAGLMAYELCIVMHKKGKSCVRNCKGRLVSIFMVVLVSSIFESIKQHIELITCASDTCAPH